MPTYKLLTVALTVAEFAVLERLAAQAVARPEFIAGRLIRDGLERQQGAAIGGSNA